MPARSTANVRPLLRTASMPRTALPSARSVACAHVRPPPAPRGAPRRRRSRPGLAASTAHFRARHARDRRLRGGRDDAGWPHVHCSATADGVLRLLCERRRRHGARPDRASSLRRDAEAAGRPPPWVTTSSRKIRRRSSAQGAREVLGRSAVAECGCGAPAGAQVQSYSPGAVGRSGSATSTPDRTRRDNGPGESAAALPARRACAATRKARGSTYLCRWRAGASGGSYLRRLVTSTGLVELEIPPAREGGSPNPLFCLGFGHRPSRRYVSRARA
jgi:hypothetical protein